MTVWFQSVSVHPKSARYIQRLQLPKTLTASLVGKVFGQNDSSKIKVIKPLKKEKTILMKKAKETLHYPGNKKMKFEAELL